MVWFVKPQQEAGVPSLSWDHHSNPTQQGDSTVCVCVGTHRPLAAAVLNGFLCCYNQGGQTGEGLG